MSVTMRTRWEEKRKVLDGRWAMGGFIYSLQAIAASRKLATSSTA
jgi:hypothetical protein